MTDVLAAARSVIQQAECIAAMRADGARNVAKLKARRSELGTPTDNAAFIGHHLGYTYGIVV